VGAPVSDGGRWRRTPPLPEDLARLVRPHDPDWFAREMAIAAAPPWWFWRFLLRRFSWLVGLFGSVEPTRHAVRVTEVALVQGAHVVAYPEGADRAHPGRLARPTRPTTAVAAFPGGVVPDDLP
jgi:hypothetical protein